jgi:putative ABC transport system permease protein
MTTVWLALGADIRRRWRTMLGLVLLLGLIGGVALTAAAGARRTDTAYPRLLSWANASQLDIVPQGTGLTGYYAALAKLPEISALGSGQLYQATLPASHATEVQLESSPDGVLGTSVDRVKVLSGRRYDPARPGEAMIDQQMAAAEHLQPGGTARVLGVPLDPKTGAPDFGKAVALSFTVTAIVAFDPQLVLAGGGDIQPTVMISSPFAATPAAATLSVGDEAAVRLRHGASMTRLIADASTLARHYPDTHGKVDVINPASQVAAAQQAVRPQAIALAAFAALAGLIGLAVLSQLLSRQLALDAADYPVLRAVGATRAMLSGLSLARLAVITVAGAVLAVAIAVAASPLTPIGAARLAEPHPGADVNLAILGAGAAVLALCPLLLLTPAAWRAAARAASPLGAHPAVARGRASWLAGLLGRTGAVSGAIGVRMAFEAGRGRTAVPVRSALAGAAIAVAAVTAAAVFGASLVGLVSTPRLYGQNWDAMTDLGFGSVTGQTAAQVFKAEPAVTQLAAGDYGAVTIGGQVVPAIGLDQVRGTGFLTLLAGRAPAASGEVALGAQTMRAAHLRLGQTVTVTADHEATTAPDRPAAMRIVGEVVFAQFSRGSFAPTGLGTGAVVPASVLSETDPYGACDGPVCYNFFLLRFRPGTDVTAQAARLTAALVAQGCPVSSCVTSADQRPADIRNYAGVRDTPLVLAAVLVLFAIGTLAHLLVTGVRRRRRDLAVLKTLGFARPQMLGAVAWQATAFAAIALLIGLPTGILAGRWAWVFFANAAGVPADATVPLTAILLAVPATLALANLIAAWPGWTAARLRPALVLRTE